MKRRTVIAGLMSMALFLPLSAGAEGTMLIGGQPVPLGPVDVAGSHAPGNQASRQITTAQPGQSKPSTVFRDLPSVSGSYAVHGTTLMPYVGAGFNSGYTSDLDRSLHGTPQVPTDSSLRSLFGQNLAPNEFQMGVRIPF